VLKSACRSRSDFSDYPVPVSDLLGAGSIWSSNVDSASTWIWIGPSDWRIRVDLRLI
jgi:hypothetical protein